MSTRRLRIRSTQAPAGRPMTRNAAYSAAVSTPISHSVAASCWTAKIGSASTVSWAPSCPRASPVQSRRKSGWWISDRLVAVLGGAHAAQHRPLIGKCQSLCEDRHHDRACPPRARPTSTPTRAPSRARCRSGSCGCASTSRSTNREIAERLDRNPATVLHHVRTLVDRGFLAAAARPAGDPRGARGAVPRDRQVVAHPRRARA